MPSRNKKCHIINPKKFSRGPPPMSISQARNVTAKYHVLNSKLELLKQAENPSPQTEQEISRVQAEIDAMGGHAAYQQASVLNTDKFKTSKYVFSTLTRLGARPKAGEPPLKTLEIGAINLQLFSCFWLQVRAIDLVSQHPGKIEALDFMDLPLASNEQDRFQVMVCFMVLNFVPDAVKRGAFLERMVQQLRIEGYLFLALPLRCLDQSDLMTREWFIALVESLGVDLKDARYTPKVAFFTFTKAGGSFPRLMTPSPPLFHATRHNKNKTTARRAEKARTDSGIVSAEFDIKLSNVARRSSETGGVRCPIERQQVRVGAPLLGGTMDYNFYVLLLS
jgi:25S rRNA (adenine2142-N1)-methyltransferase